METIFLLKSSEGYFPNCDLSRNIAELNQQKFFTEEDLFDLKSVNFEIVVVEKLYTATGF